MTDDVLAFFITWTCFGTFLPGDERGWTRWHKGDQLSRPALEDWCRGRMTEEAVWLDRAQREIVNGVVRKHSDVRGWILHEVNCRSNHCHVVVTAAGYDGEQVRDQFKAWATRRLKEQQVEQLGSSDEVRERWWTRKGSVRKIYDDGPLEAAILYTRDAQDLGGSQADAV